MILKNDQNDNLLVEYFHLMKKAIIPFDSCMIFLLGQGLMIVLVDHTSRVTRCDTFLAIFYNYSPRYRIWDNPVTIPVVVPPFKTEKAWLRFYFEIKRNFNTTSLISRPNFWWQCFFWKFNLKKMNLKDEFFNLKNWLSFVWKYAQMKILEPLMFTKVIFSVIID